ncbi:MAG: carboxypeptidase-like regulatory domain-containing protein [Mariniphaga sp.]|nr:carboxypeptidase-like regulatory domain-containing protein [Mariniphaga sp.]
MKKLFILLFLFPLQLFGQIDLSGIVIDSSSNEPIEFASIYLNGTTIGTISNSSGKFLLEDAYYPCELIVSHISYNSRSFLIENQASFDSIIILSPKDIIIKEISLKDINLREKNLWLFKTNFLGNDKWGKNAFIENEEALRFNWEYDTIKLNFGEKKPSFFDYLHVLEYIDRDINKTKDDTFKTYLVPRRFSTTALDPLRIQLPLLGYMLQYDLKKFNMEFNFETDFVMWKYLGYSYFQPINSKSKSLQKRIIKNRQIAYYNSPQHLNKSMFNKTLRKNGYVVSELVDDSFYNDTFAREVKPDSCWIFTKNQLKISGYKDRIFHIKYFPNIKGEPINVTNKGGRSFSESQMIFMSDTCVINANGTISDNSVLFKPFIGTKQIGASLPSNYYPENTK